MIMSAETKSDRWRVCWGSRKGTITRTKWKSFEEAAENFRRTQNNVGFFLQNAWMEAEDDTKMPPAEQRI